jgi:small ligand-binding sensory domain FIST
MKWASTVATESSLETAVEHAAAQIFADLDQEPDVLFVFVKTDTPLDLARVPALLRAEFDTSLIFGCVGDGAIGSGKEIEDGNALALTGAVLPGVDVRATHLTDEQIPPAYDARSWWEAALQVRASDDPSFILLGDPFTGPGENLLKGMDRAFPTSTKIGGIASGISQPGTTALFLNDKAYGSGVIVLALHGNIELDAVVAQGCRPIGDPIFVTAVHENLIREFDGKPPRDVLNEVYDKLSADDQELFSSSLFLGIAMDTRRSEFGPGDFLVRNILGMDPQSGALWINTELPLNGIVQLHLRDAVTSAQDLERMLNGYRNLHHTRPGGVLLFSCLGRGAQLYGQPDHDCDAFRRLVADVPIGGFFCNGEIGPVNGKTFLHSYTSSFGLFRPKTT